MAVDQYPLLDTINSPTELRAIAPGQLPQLAREIRSYLLNSLNMTGGHLGGSLGTVELAIAIHYIFNTPSDNLIWDVGHQAYPHKILTERKHLFHTLRKAEGLAPFPRREESVYDAFGVGHSSTSISAALGMAVAHQLSNNENVAIAVIGDGAMTAGLAYEALNHGGVLPSNLLVILNDNEMSISENVGGLSKYCARLLASKTYREVKRGGEKLLKRVPPLWELARRTDKHLRQHFLPGGLFMELGFEYTGPIDGHNMESLLETLSSLKDAKGPRLLHVVTQKGHGYTPAQADPIGYHAVSPGFLNKTASSTSAQTSSHTPSVPKLSYSAVFGQWLCETAEADKRVIGITPAMREGSGMVEFAQRFPERFFDVAIAEQHAVTFAAGLATQGYRPVVAIYSSFLQRAYDQVIHDVAIQNLPVVFALDRAGLVGDGPTHSGNFDISFMRCIPNCIIMAPSDEQECKNLLSTGLAWDGPSFIRYPRDTGRGLALTHGHALAIGKARIVREGQSMVLCSWGSMLATALELGQTFDATVVDMRFVKPLDETLLLELAQTHSVFVTLEEGTIAGGAGSAVNELLAASGTIKLLNFGLPDHFVEHGTRPEMLRSCGLTAEQIQAKIHSHLSMHETIE